MGHPKAASIRYAGAGRDEEEAARPALLEARPGRAGRVALVAFTDNEPSFAAGPDRLGTNRLPVSLEPGILGRVEAAIAGAREAGAETVVFSKHRGPNMVERPSDLFRKFARAVVDRGADVYYGHSAHHRREAYARARLGGRPSASRTGEKEEERGDDRPAPPRTLAARRWV